MTTPPFPYSTLLTGVIPLPPLANTPPAVRTIYMLDGCKENGEGLQHQLRGSGPWNARTHKIYECQQLLNFSYKSLGLCSKNFDSTCQRETEERTVANAIVVVIVVVVDCHTIACKSERTLADQRIQQCILHNSAKCRSSSTRH
jgi:hypothetical protein